MHWKRWLTGAIGLSIAGMAAGEAPSPPASSTAGKLFFEANVVPRLAENGCPICHARGYVHPNVIVYEDLLPYLAMGDAAESTPVIRKMANLRAFRPDIPTHVGGPRCETLESEPCKTILQWWRVEFGSQQATGGDRQ